MINHSFLGFLHRQAGECYWTIVFQGMKYFFPGFGMGIIVACFQDLGNYFSCPNVIVCFK